METISFRPRYKTIDHLNSLPLRQELKKETMFFRSSPQFVRQHGGPIANKFLDVVEPLLPPPRSDRYTVIDARVHSLNEGMYPCIPGYHLDFVRPDKQKEWKESAIPDFDHYIAIIGESSMTEYIAQPVKLQVPEILPKNYMNFNQQLKDMQPKTVHVENGQILHFTSHDWHRGTPASQRESRFFIRASVVDLPPHNEIRTQSQVYMSTPEASW